MFNNDKKFDIDLAKGQQAESLLASLITDVGEKIEVKSEGYIWLRTGNIAIEYESYGKPSGIAATEAEWWAHCLRDGSDEVSCIVLMPVQKLKKVARLAFKEAAVQGGDNKASKMVLIELSKLFDYLAQI